MGKVSCTQAENNREIYDGQHQAIISEDLWEKCQNVRASRRHLSRAMQKKYRNYLLSTLAVCDVCGRTLRAQGPSTGSYYREMSYERGYIDCPHQKTGVRAELLEKQVHELIKYIQLPEDWIKGVADQAGDENEMINLRCQRIALKQSAAGCSKCASREISMTTWMSINKRRWIVSAGKALPTHDQIESLKVTAKTIGDLYQVWESADSGDQRDLLRLMLREVRVDVPNGRITSIAPLAVFVPIFRKLSMLFEYEFGYFLPLWNEVTFPAVEQLPAVQETLRNSPTLLFFDINPLVPQTEIRNTPAIAEALRLSGKK